MTLEDKLQSEVDDAEDEYRIALKAYQDAAAKAHKARERRRNRYKAVVLVLPMPKWEAALKKMRDYDPVLARAVEAQIQDLTQAA